MGIGFQRGVLITNMKAIVYHNDTLKLEEIEKPTPGDEEVLVKVRACSVNPFDSHLLRHSFMRWVLTTLGRQKGARPGRDLAGDVEAVGRNVTQFKPGDAVFGLSRGAFAEYACTSQSMLAMKPENASFEQAASVPLAGLTALQGVRDRGKVKAGQQVLINGASGGVGAFAVQIARSLGSHVTGVCSTRNVEMVRSIGADHVIDYTREDFTKNGQRYDVIIDVVANHSFSARRRALNPRGISVAAGVLARPSMMNLLTDTITNFALSRFVSQKFVMLAAKVKREDLVTLGELLKEGKIVPVIDRSYSLSEAFEAIRYLEQKHARGKVVIAV